MTLQFLPPMVENVKNGELNVFETPSPAITVSYKPIDKPHTISVMWEIYGADRWIYCCVLASRPANSSSFMIKAWDQYTSIRSPGCDIRVWYSVSIDGGPLLYSEPNEFHAISEMGQPPGSSQSDLAVREAVAQYFQGNFMITVDLNTDLIGDNATIYATWSTMGSRARRITWGKRDEETYLWQSEFKKAEVDSDGQLRPVIFEIPKEELLKLDGDYGVLALRAEEGSTTTARVMFTYINYVESEGALKERSFELRSDQIHP